MKRIVTLSLVLLAITAVRLPALAVTLTYSLNASGPITLTGSTCPAGTPTGDQCYSISGSLSQAKKTVALSGTVISSSTPSATKSGNCYAIFNSSIETATSGPDVVNINLTGQACVATSKGAVTETLKSGAWIGTHILETGTGKESWTITPTDDLSTTAPLAGTGKLNIKGTLNVGA